MAGKRLLIVIEKGKFDYAMGLGPDDWIAVLEIESFGKGIMKASSYHGNGDQLDLDIDTVNLLWDSTFGKRID